jgi:Tol biopolymer transport system component
MRVGGLEVVKMRTVRGAIVGSLALLVVTAPLAASADPWDAPSRQLWGSTTRLVSVDLEGMAAYGSSTDADVSEDGRYVAFQSTAKDLVAEPVPDSSIFVRDMETRSTVLVSAAWDGGEADARSTWPSISDDGHYVAFTSKATNLVQPATRPDTDEVYVRDLVAGTTVLASVRLPGFDELRGSLGPSLSGNGRYVAFHSAAANLVEGDTNDNSDVFRHDLLLGTTVRVSLGPRGAQLDQWSRRMVISRTGRYVAFVSGAQASRADTDDRSDIFVRDLLEGTTRMVSVSSKGEGVGLPSRGPAISANGRCVTFSSKAGRLVRVDRKGTKDVFVHDLEAGTTRLVSRSTDGRPANDDSRQSSVSGRCRFVAFDSYAYNLVPLMTVPLNRRNVYVRDLARKTTKWVSFPRNPDQRPIGTSGDPAISRDGRHIAFTSHASYLVNNDENRAYDVYLRSR